MSASVQRLGTFTIVHLDRFEGMPEELDGVRLVVVKPSTAIMGLGGHRRLYVADEVGPFKVRDAPEPTEFVEGVLAAAAQIEEADAHIKAGEESTP